MRLFNKLMTILISVVFIASGILAQSDAPPKLKDQLEQKVKPPKLDKNTQELGTSERAPTATEQIIQTVIEEQRDPAMIYWPQERDMSEKSYPININSSDEMFDLQFTWPVGVGDGEAGIETDDSYIYTTKWNGNDFYKYDLSGNLLETFTCGTASAIRDLAYDGTYFYGSPASTTVFQMDFNTQTVVSTFSAPSNIRAIAYNENENLFYGNNWSDDIQVFDPTGALVAVFPAVTPDRSYYGFAYDNYCGGTYLWGYSQLGTVPADQNILIQIELPSGNETGVTFDVATLITPTTGSAGGLCISNALYTGTYTIMGNMQNEYIWGLELCLSGPPPANDVGIESIVSPESGINLTSTEPVTVNIKNFGDDPQSNFDVWFEMDGGGQVVETITATINSGETLVHTFVTTVDLSAFGTYEIEACTDLASDENPANDCKTKSVENSEPSQSFCQPNFSTGCSSDDGLTDFAVDAIQNFGSGCADNTGFPGWSEYYELGPAILIPGFVHTFTMGTGFGNQYVNIWIDYNDDMVLDMDEMILQLYWLESLGVLYDVEITIPANATPGEHKMRAMAVYSNNTWTDPCGTYNWGEAEDYTIIINVPDYGDLEGYVIENTGGASLEGAMISVNNGIWETTTGADGYYEIIDVMVGDWPVTCNKDGYNPASATVNVAIGVTTQQDFAMTAPTLDITPTFIDIVIDPNAQAIEYIDIANNGDGMLGWSAQLEMLTENTDDAWDLQFSFDLDAATGAAGNAGAECDGQYYYTTRWDSDLIHKFDFDGNLIEEFSIGGVTGLRDLAFDGTYMYGGAATNTIYEMDFVGQTLMSSFTSSQPVRSIAYDDGNDAFWVSNWDSDIDLVDKSGVTINTFPASTHGLDGIYGSAYDTWSTGSPLLWIFDQGAGVGAAQIIYEANLNSLSMTGFSYDVMADLGPNDQGIAGGLFIVGNVYPGILSIGGLLQGTPDVFFMYELAPAEPVWITIDPTSGTIDQGNTGIMDVNFDATDIVAGTVKTANIHFSSDPDIGSVTVPVSMTVGTLQFGYIEGNVFLDGAAAYNIGDVTEVEVTAGPYSDNPDENGDYQINVYPGTYDVIASLYGYETQTVTGVVVGVGVTVTGIDITMPCLYGIVFGTVTAVTGGGPIEGAEVKLVGTEFETTTLADGTYEIIVESGTYDVLVLASGYGSQTAAGTAINPEVNTTVDFQLEDLAGIIVVIDLDPTPTGAVLTPILQNMFPEGLVVYTTNINGYTLDEDVLTVFLLLGIFDNNYELTEDDAAVITTWIESYDNRSIYMEGGDTWTFDDPTPLHAYFNINGVDDGAGDLLTVTGIASFWEGNVWTYIGENAWIDHLEPIAPATSVLENQEVGYFTSVAYDEGTYKTIGSSHEIMGLTDGPGTEYAIASILAYFDYDVFVFGSLEGYVTENLSGNPIEGALVDVSGLASTLSGSDGYYFIEEVLIGEWEVTCSKDNYVSQNETVTIEEDVTSQQDFELVAPGHLSGMVTDASSGNPIEGANIDVGGIYSTTSLNDGSYLIENILIGTYDVTCSFTGYNSNTGTVLIEEGQSYTQDFDLEAPEIVVSPMVVEVIMDPNTLFDDFVNISNPGLGSVDWSASVVTIDGGGSDDPWDLQFSFDLDAATGAAGNAGAECDGEYYYSTRWVSDLIHKFDFSGNLIEEFSIAGVSGLRDLAFDGTYMYGGATANTIYEMDFVTQTLISSISSPQIVRSIAYDNGEDGFWCANWDTDITLVSKAGTALNSIPAATHGLSGMYGSAYDDWTTDVPTLWIFDKGAGAGTAQLIHEADLNAMAMTGFSYDVMNDLGPNTSAIAGGLFLVEGVYPGVWSIGGLLQGTPDTYFMYELGSGGPLWLTIEPISGSLNGGEDEDITLHFNTFDLLPADYFAEIHFSSNPNVGEPVVDVTLHVEGLVPATNLELDFNCTDIIATWEMPASGNPDSWNIYKDGVLLTNTTEMTYTDEMVEPEVEYGYYITAVYGGEESSATSTENITVPVPADLEVTDLEGTASGYTAFLDWSEPPCCVAPDSYNIYRDGSMVDNTTETEYTDPDLPQALYEYYVVAVYYFGDSDDSEPVNVLIPSVGIDDLTANAYQIYPNPATDLVNVKAPVEMESIQVLNNAGQLVVDENVNADFYQIDVSQLESGIYYIKLEAGEGLLLRKITIR